MAKQARVGKRTSLRAFSSEQAFYERVPPPLQWTGSGKRVEGHGRTGSEVWRLRMIVEPRRRCGADLRLEVFSLLFSHVFREQIRIVFPLQPFEEPIRHAAVAPAEPVAPSGIGIRILRPIL